MVSHNQLLTNTIVERIIDTHEEVKRMYCLIDSELDDDSGYASLVDSCFNAMTCAYDKAVAVKKATKDD